MSSGSAGSLLISNIGQLVTNESVDGDLSGIVQNAAVAIVDGTIDWVGHGAAVPARYRALERLDAAGSSVVPGFVDAHTHAVFAGDRSDEFARRMAGESYASILASGGGIHSTVRATRSASLDELVDVSLPRFQRMAAAGTTTVEVKSGYGLDVENERKIVDAILEIGSRVPIDVVPTFLGAHVVPPEYADDRAAYVRLVSGPMLDAVVDDVAAVDVFCDEIAFTTDETRQVIGAAANAGLPVRLHADQVSRTGGAALAAETGAIAVDHLDHANTGDLEAMKASGTVAVLLPAVSHMMREPAPDARRVWDTGLTVAIATDCNPGTANVETMPFVISLAVITSGLTIDEAVWAATRGGALALGLHDRGFVAAGACGDLVVLNARTHADLAYRPDGRVVGQVIKSGVLVTADRPVNG